MLLPTKLSCLQKNNFGHTKVSSNQRHFGEEGFVSIPGKMWWGGDFTPHGSDGPGNGSWLLSNRKMHDRNLQHLTWVSAVMWVRNLFGLKFMVWHSIQKPFEIEFNVHLFPVLSSFWFLEKSKSCKICVKKPESPNGVRPQNWTSILKNI